MKVFKKNYGITLIALVITIIVLLILAGVAISMLAGENGILQQAAKAKINTEEQSTLEKIKLAATAAITNTEHKVNKEQLDVELEKYGYSESSGNEEDGYIVKDSENKFIIRSNGEVEEVNSSIVKMGPWKYKEDAKGRKTIITDGKIELPIGTFVNYNASAIDADEKEKNVENITSYAGSPTATGSYTAKDQILAEGNGASDQKYINTAQTNGWRVLGVDETEGTILIISTDPIKTSANKGFYLRGIAGYNYGEGELNKVCSIFGNGFGAIKARSININDINKITGYNPENIGQYDPEQKGTGNKYKSYDTDEYLNSLTYYWKGTTCPYYYGTNGAKGFLGGNHLNNGFNWYDIKEKVWKHSPYSSTASSDSEEEIATITSDLYYYEPSTNVISSTAPTAVGIEKTSQEYYTLFTDKSKTKIGYWIAGSYIHCTPSECVFGMHIVTTSGYVGRQDLYNSVGRVQSHDTGVRPVVTLKADIQLEYEETKQYYDIIG